MMYVFVAMLRLLFKDNKNYGQITMLIDTRNKSVILIESWPERSNATCSSLLLANNI